MPTPSQGLSSINSVPNAPAEEDRHQEPRSLGEKSDRIYLRPVQMTVLVLSIAVALAGLWVSNSYAAVPDLLGTNATNGTGDLPIVDLGYTVQQATSFNVSLRFEYGILSLSSSRGTGIKWILHLFEHSLRGSSNGRNALCSSARPFHQSNSTNGKWRRNKMLSRFVGIIF